MHIWNRVQPRAGWCLGTHYGMHTRLKEATANMPTLSSLFVEQVWSFASSCRFSLATLFGAEQRWGLCSCGSLLLRWTQSCYWVEIQEYFTCMQALEPKCKLSSRAPQKFFLWQVWISSAGTWADYHKQTPETRLWQGEGWIPLSPEKQPEMQIGNVQVGVMHLVFFSLHWRSGSGALHGRTQQEYGTWDKKDSKALKDWGAWKELV